VETPPEQALQKVVSIGMGLSWDGTVTADGQFWIWGRDGLLDEDCLPDYQGNFVRLFALDSDQIEAQLKDGRILRFRHFHTIPQIFDAPVPHQAVFHSGTHRIFREAGGSWHAYNEVPAHRPFLDQLEGKNPHSIAIRLRTAENLRDRKPENAGGMILIEARAN
jgi:hypothetical protein